MEALLFIAGMLPLLGFYLYAFVNYGNVQVANLPTRVRTVGISLILVSASLFIMGAVILLRRM